MNSWVSSRLDPAQDRTAQSRALGLSGNSSPRRTEVGGREPCLPRYGQRLAVSSHPAARAGCGLAFTAPGGMRIGCCAVVGGVNVGLLLLASTSDSLSSDNKGAA